MKRYYILLLIIIIAILFNWNNTPARFMYGMSIVSILVLILINLLEKKQKKR